MSASKIASLVLCVACCACAPATNTQDATPTYISVLEAASGKNGSEDTTVATMNALYELREKAENPSTELLSLLDYYVGDANSGILDEFITKQGKPILAELRKKMGSPVLCIPNFEGICRPDTRDRDQRIGRLVEAIEAGKVLCVDNSDC